MSIIEPIYITTRRVKTGVKSKIMTVLHAGTKRVDAAAEAVRLCRRGLSTVVYECKIVEVHHPSKKARRERGQRLLRRRRK